eukprot:Protomagalhaensia_sp_Gyna_25__4825@NODE_496_length_3265_cov_96_813391_g387_i0_p1_GENE_NODE_496_length_3265_cov_96_813391_g387_i0NODE_496_length_3265_cov_96_813391_g387_i0_p1_ORF_typecomplete_len315_score8_57SprTlike/PF10263_9/9_1e17SprTlike/PF10263_9/2_5e03Peptidase_M76/PF09768_9/0_044_NODE_496_length_3265_cov_96_813391_g387_i02961240
MTLCAGICYYKRHPTKAQILQASKQIGGVESLMSLYPRCIIRLSEPLLIYRDTTDLKQTLIHEMIHAYCFKFNLEKSRDGHGAVFCNFMNTINQATGLRITVYHSFSEEVEHARKHVWRCNGPCQNSKPYYGYVKRAMNRAPGPSDWWYSRHRSECGGFYVKIAGPDLDARAAFIPESESSKLHQRRLSDFTSPIAKTQQASIKVETNRSGHNEGCRKRTEKANASGESPPKILRVTTAALPTTVPQAHTNQDTVRPPISISTERSVDTALVESALAELSCVLGQDKSSKMRAATKRPWITLESKVRAKNKNHT